MRLGILGKLTLLNALIIIVTIIIISLISWTNNSSYIYSRLNTRFPTLAVTKAQQFDQYVASSISSVRAIASRILLQAASTSFVQNGSLNATQNSTAQEDLSNGVNFTSSVLSARVYALNPNQNSWQSIIQYIPNNVDAQYYAPKIYEALIYPPKEGITNPFTIENSPKYIFVITIMMSQNQNNSYLQVIFDAEVMIQIIQQVSNLAEASTEYLLLTLNTTTNRFRLLLPTLYHPSAITKTFYTISSDAAVSAAANIAHPIPVSFANLSSLRTYQTGVEYDYNNFDGLHFTAACTRLYFGAEQSWALIVQAPQNQVVAPFNKLRNILLISDFSTLIIMILILMPILWWFSKPLRTLRTVTQAAHEAPINIEGLSVPEEKEMVLGCIPRSFVHDEIMDLNESFILLAQSLNEQYYSLEAKVASRTQEAVAANQMKSSFLANMSHEIRSPLQSVIALADIDMLEDRNISEEIKQTLNTIKESGDHLLFLISDILDFSKIEAGHLVLEERMFALGQGLINQLRISFRSKADEVGLRFDIITEPPELYQYKVRGDKHRLYQILSNLLSNAVKFTISGSVTFRVSYTPPDQFQFAITDTGCGIPPTVLEKLFQPFTQADSSYSRKFGGTGLGLAVSKRLAALMGGAITVTSEAEKGSTFTLQVPLQIGSDVLDDQPPENNNNNNNNSTTPISQLSMNSHLSQGSQISSTHSVRNVMVADDNLVNRQVLSKMLNRCGVHQITTAVNGQEALNIAQKRVFDLILMDCAMPVTDGYEATRLLRESKYEGMIVALTAHIGTHEHEKALESGVDHVLTKPITLKELKAFLHGIGK